MTIKIDFMIHKINLIVIFKILKLINIVFIYEEMYSTPQMSTKKDYADALLNQVL